MLLAKLFVFVWSKQHKKLQSLRKKTGFNFLQNSMNTEIKQFNFFSFLFYFHSFMHLSAIYMQKTNHLSLTLS